MDNDEKKSKKNLPNVKVKMSGLSPKNKKKKNDNIKNNQKKYSSKEKKKTKKKAKKENTPRLRDLLTDEQLEKIKAKRRHNALIVISVFLLTILFSGIILGIQFYANRSSLKFKENGTSGNINLVFLNYTVNKYDLSKGAMVAKFTSTEKK